MPTHGTVLRDGVSVCCAEDGEEVHFVRAIVPSSASEDASFQSQYRLNERTVSLETYTNKLKSFGILVKARNFLVFQARYPEELHAWTLKPQAPNAPPS